MYCRHKCFHTLFDYGLMSNYNVMCSSLDPMEELTAAPPYPSWSRTWAWVISPPPPPSPQTGNPGSITEIELYSLVRISWTGCPYNERVTSQKRDTVFLRPHPSWGWLQMTNSFCCLYLLFSVSVPAPSSFIKMLDPCTHNVHVLHVCASLLIVTYMWFNGWALDNITTLFTGSSARAQRTWGASSCVHP